MGMSKYKIKENAHGLFIVFALTDAGGGYYWKDTMHRFETKEAAQAYIEQLKGERHEK